MKYYITALRNFGNFSGRARRSEYWYFVLFNFIFSCVALGIDYALGTTIDYESYSGYSSISIHLGYVNLLFGVLMLIPALAVAVRRLHDVGKSGWYLLIAFIPLIGGIWLLVLFCTDSVPGPNKWGPNPKDIGNDDDINAIGTHMDGR